MMWSVQAGWKVKLGMRYWTGRVWHLWAETGILEKMLSDELKTKSVKLNTQIFIQNQLFCISIANINYFEIFGKVSIFI